MTQETHPPSIREKAFDCPHCGAYTTQYWYYLCSREPSKENNPPFIPDDANIKAIENASSFTEEERGNVVKQWRKIAVGKIFFGENQHYSSVFPIHNLYLSECFVCKKIAVWRHDSLLFPPEKVGE